jgi:carbon-monoxide dehydrogenase catalytic subunit
MSEKSSEEKLRGTFLNLKTGIKALKLGMELLESGVKKLEEKILGLTKEVKKVEIKVEKIEREKEPEKIEILEKIYERPLEEITFELSNKTLEKIYEKIHKEKPALYTIPKRIEERKPTKIKKEVIHCTLCNFGPCEIVEDKEESKGICGADASMISAKNFARLVGEGAAINLERARRIAEIFKGAVTKEIPFQIKDKKKLKLFAYSLGIDLNLPEEKILEETVKKIFRMFSQQEGELISIHRAPQNLIEKWRKYKVIPRGMEREILELIYRTSMGVDHYYKNILLSAVRCSLSDGWGSSLITTELQDILFGTPKPIKSFVNIGENVIFKDMVNVVVHGQDPIMADLLREASFDSEIIELTKEIGAKGINLVGLCDTGNELLMRKGIPALGTFIHQEAVIATGAIEAIVLDGDCVAPNIVQIANQFHTAIITTNPLSMMEGVIYVEFNKNYPLESAKEILKISLLKYKERKNSEIYIPDDSVEVISGFSLEALMYIMGGRFRASLELLNENLINGKILGIAVITGDDYSGIKENVEVELTKELIANNILVLTTGCSAIKLGMAGLLTEEATKLAGEGLREVIEGIGCPPVLHMGSLVDNSRILQTLIEIINTGGLGKDIRDLPVVVCIPQWINTKAISLGMYFSASGIQVIFGSDFPFIGSKKTAYFLFNEMENYFGGAFKIASKASDFVNMVIDRIWQKRKELGIDKPKPRLLYDMAMRKVLDEKIYIPSIHKLGGFEEK